ncbi:hypothetical protein FGO68_gene16368 [Halteria grandinella]|uniref:Uncharacterized protein n=1 Tax=Halteria grandinella TaxID=5974 RepID=A0A8J8P6E2_HALGN|nr:hypothetical protein FGO68_gene16368 [Halteria grandinella]
MSILSLFISLYQFRQIVFLVKNYGPLRELNPGPPAPEAGIMPLDQVATVIGLTIDAAYVHSEQGRGNRGIINQMLGRAAGQILKVSIQFLNISILNFNYLQH